MPIAARVDREEIHWPDWADDPFPLYRVLRDEHPVYYDRPNNEFLLTRYEDVSAVMSDPERFSNVPEWRRTERPISPLNSNDPPRHTYLRRLIMPMFMPKAMRRLDPFFQQLACELLDAAEARGDEIEVSSQLAIPLPGRVTCDLLGVPLEEHQRFLDLTAERMAVIAGRAGKISVDLEHRELPEIQADLWSIVGPAVEARRHDPQHDAITLLVQAQERDGHEAVSNDDIVDMLLNLLTAGFHTTQHLIEMLTSQLADRPDLWQRLRADRSLVPVAIEEMLRFDAPAQAMLRRAVEPTVIHGVEIPAGSMLAVVFGSANRDERAFDDPDTFSLDRQPNRHMAFSVGIHYCPGAPVSRFEVRALFDEMLDRYETIERTGPSQRWVTQSPTVAAIHGYHPVPVRVVRR